MKYLATTTLLAVLPAIALADGEETVCSYEKDQLVKSYCACREIENDIERLQCFDRNAILQIAVRRVLRAKALDLAETEAGKAAMLEALGLPANFDLDGWSGARQ